MYHNSKKHIARDPVFGAWGSIITHTDWVKSMMLPWLAPGLMKNSVKSNWPWLKLGPKHGEGVGQHRMFVSYGWKNWNWTISTIRSGMRTLKFKEVMEVLIWTSNPCSRYWRANHLRFWDLVIDRSQARQIVSDGWALIAPCFITMEPFFSLLYSSHWTPETGATSSLVASYESVPLPITTNHGLGIWMPPKMVDNPHKSTNSWEHAEGCTNRPVTPVQTSRKPRADVDVAERTFSKGNPAGHLNAEKIRFHVLKRRTTSKSTTDAKVSVPTNPHLPPQKTGCKTPWPWWAGHTAQGGLCRTKPHCHL